MEERYTAGTWVQESRLHQIRTPEPEPVSQLTRQGNTAFPTVGILKKPKNRKKKATW